VFINQPKEFTLMTYYYYKDSKGKWRWHLKACDGRIIAHSAQSYENKEECLHHINLVKQSGSATVIN